MGIVLHGKLLGQTIHIPQTVLKKTVFTGTIEPLTYLHLTMDSHYTRDLIIISDGTGITAEKFAYSLLTQFDITTKTHRFPFVDTEEKACIAIERVNEIASKAEQDPLVFLTLVNPELSEIVKTQANGFFVDLFNTFVEPLEKELQLKSNHTTNKLYHNADSESYRDRIEAINYTLMHDDGQTNHNLVQADVILVGVSRCGKTPTSLYLALQHGIKAANYPLIPEDFERNRLPSALDGFHKKIFGLTINPMRLSEIRYERRAGSKYAAIENCRYEVSEAEKLMRRHGIHWLSTTNKSIEEIATTILQEFHFENQF